jgi:IclR family transcriptional regulator, acetate operon repressor
MRLTPPTVKSLDRGLDILEYVAGCAQPPSFSQLLQDLRIPRSSLFHLLTNLLSRGFLERDIKTERYRLGARISKLARNVKKPPLGDRVAPFLQQLSLDTHETCGFYVQRGDWVVVVASAISTQALSYTMKVGMRAPLYAVSAGKLVLAELSSEELDNYLAHVRLTAVTPHTIRSKSRLRKEVHQIKSTGFAYSREEFTLGITAIATAVRNEQSFYGAINLAVPTARFTSERNGAFRETLRRTAGAIAGAIR